MLTATVFLLIWVSIPEPGTNFAFCEPNLLEMWSLTAGVCWPRTTCKRR
jgi:hypothetical protein